MAGDALPALEPKLVAAGSKEELTLELRTYAFVVLPKAKHPACADVRRPPVREILLSACDRSDVLCQSGPDPDCPWAG